MGAWGAGNFENDDALDFIGALVAADDLQPIRTLVEEVINQKDIPLDAGLAAQALAAGEVVAALRGHPGKLPEEALRWVSGKKAASMELRLLAHSAVLQALNDSELRALWAETEAFDEWRAAVRDLLKRLSLHRPGPKDAVNKALKKVSQMTSYLCSFCGEPIEKREFTSLWVKGKKHAEVVYYAHAACLDDHLILQPRGER